ncbi:MAG: class I mannose-6-phosphate isomerase, partial [Negativicutes bacterium]|nr:class I mannose-6-phosphate isomerase [Negativicutes bacterium]
PVVGWETGGNFPLLIKIIDAADDLSVQVHPDEDVADASLDEAAKTEAWYVLRAGQGTKIVYGLKDSVSREMLELKIAKGKIDECLRMVSVKAGDLR